MQPHSFFEPYPSLLLANRGARVGKKRNHFCRPSFSSTLAGYLPYKTITHGQQAAPRQEHKPKSSTAGRTPSFLPSFLAFAPFRLPRDTHTRGGRSRPRPPSSRADRNHLLTATSRAPKQASGRRCHTQIHNSRLAAEETTALGATRGHVGARGDDRTRQAEDAGGARVAHARSGARGRDRRSRRDTYVYLIHCAAEGMSQVV